MRQFLRALCTGALVAVLAVAGLAGSAFAAASHSQGNGTNFEMYEEFCFDDIKIIYCLEVHGHATVVNQDDGDQIATMKAHTRWYVIEGGIIVSVTADNSILQTRFRDGVSVNEQMISRTVTATLDGNCTAHGLLKFVDGVLVIDHPRLTCD